jgi:glycerophosphoryl diester phosphodiesterase
MRLFVIILFSTFSTVFSLMAQDKIFDIQGHRGARGLMPENTIPAFIRAIDEGVHTLELDVVISKDYKVVVSHDPFFNPDISTGPSGLPVYESNKGNLFLINYKQIKKYDVGLRGNPKFPDQEKIQVHKPLLSQMIKATEEYARSKGVPPLNYNIELKSLEEEYNLSQPEVDIFSDLVHNVIFKLLPPERVTIQSFDFNILKHWRKKIDQGIYQEASLSALIEPFDNNEIEFNIDKLGFRPDVWSPYYLQLTLDRVALLHKMGIKVIPWTVNKLEDMKKIKEMGCDGLITDYPNLAKNI